MKRLVLLLTLAFAPYALTQSDGITITRESGGSIQTDLGYDIYLNRDSTLEREWITLSDASLPVQFTSEPAGLTTTYSSSDRAYRYQSAFTLDVSEPVTAIEVRFITFDIWGDHSYNYSYTRVIDLAAGQREFSGTWRALSENEVAQFYASIAYVSRVRTASGQVLVANEEPIIMEAQRFSNSFTSMDLDRVD